MWFPLIHNKWPNTLKDERAGKNLLGNPLGFMKISDNILNPNALISLIDGKKWK
jgi:hypothetical protein